jgi:SAM-dependent methyltransferase
MENYTDINSKTIDSWCDDGWEWGTPINHEVYENAQNGNWDVYLTPGKVTPHEWFCDFKGAKILGLASGGGQQMPVFTALGASCTVLDYSQRQLDSEKLVADREGYTINMVKADMTKPLPFADESFDLIFHPVSNCYIKDVQHVWNECFRILKKGGVLLAGLDNGMSFLWDEAEEKMIYKLPFDPTADDELMKMSIEKGWGVQFSHTIEEQVDGQIRAGLTLTNIWQDGYKDGNLGKFGVPCFWMTRSVKK